MTSELDALYQEIILDHYKNPHHKGLRDPYEAEVHHVNPTCGDEVTLRVHVADGPDGQLGGAIVNISSVSGHRPSPGTASYGAAKAGIDSLTQSLAVEWAPAVRVNSVVVGPVKTELAEMHYGDADGVAAVDATIPMGRMAEPADVGRAAAFLASPLGSVAPVQYISADVAARGHVTGSRFDGELCSVHKRCSPPRIRLCCASVMFANGSKE